MVGTVQRYLCVMIKQASSARCCAWNNVQLMNMMQKASELSQTNLNTADAGIVTDN